MQHSLALLLTEDDMRNRLASYENPAITDELYDSGRWLVAQAQEYETHLERKAVATAAYAIGMITVLTSTYGSWGKVIDKSLVPVIFVSALAAFVAAAYAVRALRLKEYQWISPNEWLNADCLTGRERLRKYRLLAMWKVWRYYITHSEKKADKIQRAQGWLLFAAIILVFSLIAAFVI